MALDGFRPDRWDVIGALICLVDDTVVMYASRSLCGHSASTKAPVDLEYKAQLGEIAWFPERSVGAFLDSP
jgi:hypothetical protein